MQQLVHGSLHIRHGTDLCRPSNVDARMLWRRKATASAFSTANMKAEFPNIRLACSQLIEVLKSVGPDEVVDMDSALCRESLDVIGEPAPLDISMHVCLSLGSAPFSLRSSAPVHGWRPLPEVPGRHR